MWIWGKFLAELFAQSFVNKSRVATELLCRYIETYSREKKVIL